MTPASAKRRESVASTPGGKRKLSSMFEDEVIKRPRIECQYVRNLNVEVKEKEQNLKLELARSMEESSDMSSLDEIFARSRMEVASLKQEIEDNRKMACPLEVNTEFRGQLDETEQNLSKALIDLQFDVKLVAHIGHLPSDGSTPKGEGHRVPISLRDDVITTGIFFYQNIKFSKLIRKTKLYRFSVFISFFYCL